MSRPATLTPPPPHDGRAVLGFRVREIRKRLGKTLQDVGAVAGLSKSTVSKIENGTLSVSYDNLVRLANALSIDVSELFAGATAESAVQANSRRSLIRSGDGEVYETEQYRYEMLCSDLQPKKMFPIVATLRAHTVSSTKELIRHPGEEFVYVLEGTVEVHSEFYSPQVLRPGDCMYFDSMMGHALITSGATDAKILWVATNAMSAAELTRPETPASQKKTPRAKRA